LQLQSKMALLAGLVFIVYSICIVLIGLYCLSQLYLLYSYLRFWKNKKISIPPAELDDNLPAITIQLPIYNEKYVVERLIDSITALQYPISKLQIQILDDSDDDTIEISKLKVAEYQNKGFDIVLINRKERTGFKAGALKYGMETAKSEFIAVFDADFIPDSDFLLRVIPYFEDPQVGVVQTRWEHLNQKYNFLTQLQAIQLNVHFTIEQTGRMASHYLLQFNGTAGIWRKTTIIDAGGWQSDTLTEDLDLSYRAQFKNWKIKFLEEIGAPAELPVEMIGLKSQQFRWMKGGAECAKKLTGPLWKSDLSFGQKIMGTAHLLASSIFVLVFLTGTISIFLFFFDHLIDYDLSLFRYSMLSWAIIILVYYAANFNTRIAVNPTFKDYLIFLIRFPAFLTLSMGLSFHNSIAVWEGFTGKKSSFIRTPKYDIKASKINLHSLAYLSHKIPVSTWFEIILGIIFIVMFVVTFVAGYYYSLIIYLMLGIGYLVIGIISIIDSYR